jgi:predicted NACHT family NTPase
MPRYIPGLRRVRLDTFGSDQIDRFLEKFPWTSPAKGTSLRATLKEAPELAELARMPLLLTLLALLSDVEHEVILPRRREGIYDRILSLFMGDWDRAKGIKRKYTVPDQGDRLMVLGRTALELYGRRRRTFSQQDFVQAYAVQLPSGMPNTFEAAESSLDELVRDSLLVEQPGGQLAFFHFSIHEYLAAKALAGQVSLQRFWSAVGDYFRDGWWEEVLVFYAGIKRDITPVISELHRHLIPSTSFHSDNLVNLLSRWLIVADFTDMSRIRPSGSVVGALLTVDPSLSKYRYQVYAG